MEFYRWQMLLPETFFHPCYVFFSWIMLSCFILKAHHTFRRARKYIVQRTLFFFEIYLSVQACMSDGWLSVCLFVMLEDEWVSIRYACPIKQVTVRHLYYYSLERFFLQRFLLSTWAILYLSYFKLIDWRGLQSVESDLFFCLFSTHICYV